MSSAIDNRVHSWLSIHDPALYTGPNGIHTAEALDAVNLLATATGSVQAPANSQLAGSQTSQMLATDTQAQQALQAAGGNTSNPDFLKIFAQDLAGAATTLSEMARNSAGYQPQLFANNGATSAAYQKYLTNIGSCPLFIIKMADTLSYQRNTSDWNSVIQDIANTFQGIAAGDQNAIVKGLTSLAQAASSTMSTKQTENLFVQNAMNLDNVVTLYLYSSTVTFWEESGKGFDTKQTSFNISRCELQFQAGLWPSYAAAVAAKFTSSVDDWLNNNTTPVPPNTPPIPGLQPSS